MAGGRILLVSQRPIGYGGGGSVRWQHLTRALGPLGWEVTTVSARANPTANEASTDVHRARLAQARARVMNLAGDVLRPLGHRVGVQPEAFAPNLAWALTGRRAIRQAIARCSPDIVWATAPPQSAILATVGLARAAGIPVVAELRDLWAANPYYDAGGKLLARLEAPALRGADAVVTVTPGFRETLIALHPELRPRIHVLPNGFDPTLLTMRAVDASSRGAPRKSTLIHAGTLYGDRSAAPLVRALARADLSGRVRLLLVGVVDAATKEAIRSTRGSLEVELQRPVGWSEAIKLVRGAEIAVVINSLGTGGATMVPGKLYEVLALGRPLLALTPPDSHAARLLRSLGQEAGVAAPDDEPGIAAATARLLDRAPSPVSADLLSEYNRDTVARGVAALLDALVGRGQVPRYGALVSSASDPRSGAR